MHIRDVSLGLIATGLFLVYLQTVAQAEYVVVANEHAGTLTIIDRAAGDASHSLDVGGDPHNLAATTDGRVVVTHPAG